MLNLILFGAPGCGKGTQSLFLAEHYSLDHVSTGELLREEVRKETEFGEKVEALISKGHLVSDEIILELLFEHLEEIDEFTGVILDGFPRTVGQAEALFREFKERGWVAPILVNIEVDEDILVSRLLERGKVSGRTDDNEETIRNRFKIYNSATQPVIDYYAQHGDLITVNGQAEIKEVTQRIIDAVDAFVKNR